MNAARAQLIADEVTAFSAAGEDLEVVVAHSTDTEIRVFEGEVESLVASSTAGVGIKVVSNGRVGFAHCASLDRADIMATLDAARDNARYSSPDEHAGIVVFDGVEPTLDTGSVSDFSSVSIETKIGLATELERIAQARDRRITTESCDYSDSFVVSAIASTAGIRAATEDGAASLMLSALACNEEETTAGFGMDWARAVERLDVEAVAADAVDRAVELLGATSLPSRRTTVVFDPWVTSQFLGLIGALVSGGEVVRGRSLMAGRIGEQVASQAVSIVDDPTSLRWFGAARFDAEGLATRRNEVVSRGVLSGFLHDGYSARVAGEGVRSTGSAVRAGYRSTPTAAPQALSFAGGWGSPAGLIAGMEDGVLVREVQGLHSGVNPISGDFSTGIEGRVIRNGELCEPIREVTMASTLQAMLLHIRAVCTDQRSLPGEAAGCTIAVDDVMLSGRG